VPIYAQDAALHLWRAQDRPGLARLALLDVDGCITAGEAAPLDFGLLARLQEHNRRATEDPTVPGLALCTGRQEPYVELLTQAIDGYLPSIWENGAGLYDPVGYQFLVNPALDAAAQDALDEAQNIVSASIVRPGLARRQPGKMLSISLFPTEESTIAGLAVTAAEALRPLDAYYWVQTGLSCVEVLPRGIDKGAGARWLLERLGLPPSQALGVGDAPGDALIFVVTGLGATPSNGAESTRASATYVSPLAYGAGLLDILDWCIARNRRLLEAGASA
jgi:hydroxymethylpyrimidine pyrophosphatase-like HAD family hydrolase